MNRDPFYCRECRKVVPWDEYMRSHVGLHTVKPAGSSGDPILQRLGLTKEAVGKYVVSVDKRFLGCRQVSNFVGKKKAGNAT